MNIGFDRKYSSQWWHVGKYRAWRTSPYKWVIELPFFYVLLGKQVNE